VKILFICTHNRCRSILAEAICNHYGGQELQAASAGSSPAGQVHALTIRALQDNEIPTDDLRSKSWDEMEGEEFDYVITVCDKAANESCPVWFGKSRQVHWSLKDPSAVQGEPEEVSAAFRHSIKILEQRIKQIKSYLQQDIAGDQLFDNIQRLADSE